MRRHLLFMGAISLMTTTAARAQDAVPPSGASASEPSANLAAVAAPGDRGGKFGARGQLAVSVGLPLTSEAPQLGLVHSSMGGGSSTTLSIEPSADYFMAPNLSVGGLLGIRYVSNTEPPGTLSISGNFTVLQVEARIGYNLALGDTLSLWPADRHRLFPHQRRSADRLGLHSSLGRLRPVAMAPGPALLLGRGAGLHDTARL
jgi:hypothetical protein